MDKTDALTQFGMTRQEAVIYERLCSHGPQNGYEIAKATGISRSNAYTGLAALVEKGASDTLEDTSVRYAAVSPAEFCDAKIQEMKEMRETLTKAIPIRNRPSTNGYRTIRGKIRVTACMRSMLEDVAERVYLSVPDDLMEPLIPYLKALLRDGRKVVIMAYSLPDLPDAILHKLEEESSRIRLIVDSSLVLTGHVDEGDSTCLHSGDEHLVELFKDAMRNEIRLIQNTEDT